ncbi:CBM-like domain-containing protein [Citrus sinensis]|uniref:Rhamnogalacturonan lyase domain-containing protein n=1 Tax=Citrus clementina TaxID=85681 RepID=V4S2S0_CITCL|nr:hypothetical protein CICLE_v10006636mg [Citrus x clementina]KAH9765278.1 CBM-like domain-containing protein [Citrus sinensis]
MGQITLKRSIFDTCFKSPSTPAVIFNKGNTDCGNDLKIFVPNPNDDIPYTIGVSNNTREWFFAHVTSKIIFQLENVSSKGNYTLQLALSAASYSNLRLQFNFNICQRDRRPLFSTGTIAKDNAIARHGIHGLCRFYVINVPSYLLYRGNNTIYLT